VAQKFVYRAGLHRWHRNLSLDENALLAELTVALFNVQVQAGMNDPIIWLPDEFKGFTVKGCYDLLHGLQYYAAADADFYLQ
jgi:hypothetical protein